MKDLPDNHKILFEALIKRVHKLEKRVQQLELRNREIGDR